MTTASDLFRVRHYPTVSLAGWNDWRWQMKNRITNARTLARVIGLAEPERASVARLGGSLPMAITPYYASVVSRDPDQPLRRTMVPLPDELVAGPGETADPLAEDADMPVPGLVHRYPDRALLLVTNTCASYCRYCTRSRIVGRRQAHKGGGHQLQGALAYLREHPEVRDVVVSGGDPLTMTTEALDSLLLALRSIEHIEVIRIGTKVPAVLPQRITERLCQMLRRHHPLYMSLHFVHPDELTVPAMQACARLADAGIPLGSQTVLVKGVNDDPTTMKRLLQGLMRMRVRPYYIYQCDPIPGSGHLRTAVGDGLRIMEELRGHTSGYAVPTFVIDAPGGGGKIPVAPSYVVGRDGGYLVLSNYAGEQFRYYDPIAAESSSSTGEASSARGPLTGS